MISYSLKTLKSSLEFIVHVVVDKVRDDVPGRYNIVRPICWYKFTYGVRKTAYSPLTTCVRACVRCVLMPAARRFFLNNAITVAKCRPLHKKTATKNHNNKKTKKSTITQNHGILLLSLLQNQQSIQSFYKMNLILNQFTKFTKYLSDRYCKGSTRKLIAGWW